MSLDQNFKCPHCLNHFQLSEALSHELEAKMASELGQKVEALRLEKDRALKKAEAEMQARMAQKNLEEQEALRSQLADEKKWRETAARTEFEFKKLQTEMAQREQQTLREKSDLKLALTKELSNQMEQKFSVEQQNLKNQIEEERKLALEAQTRELEILKRQSVLEAKARNQEMELNRKLEEERLRITEEAQIQAQAQSAMLMEQQNLKMASLQRALEEAQRKAQQGSQQAQGEALELKLEEELGRLFPQDQFDPVPKGVRGADLIQRVYSTSGKLAGTILWEFKQTKNWSDDWITKLKEDQRDLSAEVAAIVTNVTPKEMGALGEIDQIWVAKPLLAASLAHLLRDQLLKVYQARAASLIPVDQKESVFHYLTGTKFKLCIEGELETVSNLLGDLQKEKRAFTKIWASREQQYNKLLTFKASMYGELQGILGKSLPSISHLELPSHDEPAEPPKTGPS